MKKQTYENLYSKCQWGFLLALLLIIILHTFLGYPVTIPIIHVWGILMGVGMLYFDIKRKKED